MSFLKSSPPTRLLQSAQSDQQNKKIVKVDKDIANECGLSAENINDALARLDKLDANGMEFYYIGLINDIESQNIKDKAEKARQAAERAAAQDKKVKRRLNPADQERLRKQKEEEEAKKEMEKIERMVDKKLKMMSINREEARPQVTVDRRAINSIKEVRPEVKVTNLIYS